MQNYNHAQQQQADPQIGTKRGQKTRSLYMYNVCNLHSAARQIDTYFVFHYVIVQ